MKEIGLLSSAVYVHMNKTSLRIIIASIELLNKYGVYLNVIEFKDVLTTYGVSSNLSCVELKRSNSRQIKILYSMHLLVGI